jgi:hypothetical protein
MATSKVTSIKVYSGFFCSKVSTMWIVDLKLVAFEYRLPMLWKNSAFNVLTLKNILL